MNVVVDASIALDLFTTPKGSLAHIRAITLFKSITSGDLTAFVPDHFSIECASGAIKYQRRNKATATQAQTLEFLRQLDIFKIQ